MVSLQELAKESANSVVGIKPTVGVTSRDQVIPVYPRQDTVGAISRTVSDAVYVLDVIAGIDYNDPATTTWSKHIPQGGFSQFLNRNGLKGKRLGIVRSRFVGLLASDVTQAFGKHIQTLRHEGAVVVDNLAIASINDILNLNKSGEAVAFNPCHGRLPSSQEIHKNKPR